MKNNQKKKKLSLHLGTHKSASTHLIECLLNSKDELEKENILVFPQDEIRKKYKLPAELNRFNRGQKTSRKELDSKFDYFFSQVGDADLIISEENFLGACSDFMGSGQIYPYAQKNLTLLKEYFYNYEISIFVCVRNFKTFLPSVYGEYIRGTNDPVSFTEYSEKLDFSKVGWEHFIHRISKVFESELYVWDIESYKNQEFQQKLLKLITSSKGIQKFNLINSVTRPGMNHAALSLLKHTYDHFGVSAYRQLKKQMSHHAYWTSGEKFSPWTSMEQQYLDMRHQETLCELANVKDYVNLLK